MITQLQDELDVANVQLVELRTKHELVETQLAVCKQAEVEHITANSELSVRLSDEQERATQLEGALAKIQGEHLEVTVADLRQQLITVTAAVEQAAAQVAAKDASLVKVSACLTKVRQDAQQAKQYVYLPANKWIYPRFCPRCATPVPAAPVPDEGIPSSGA